MELIILFMLLQQKLCLLQNTILLNALKQKGKLIHLDKSYLDRIIELNFDNVSEIKTFLEKVNNNEESVALFSSKWMLKT